MNNEHILILFLPLARAGFISFVYQQNISFVTPRFLITGTL